LTLFRILVILTPLKRRNEGKIVWKLKPKPSPFGGGLFLLYGIAITAYRGRVMSLREVVRGLFGTWVSYGLGLGGEYLGVVTASMLLGIFIIVCVCFITLFLPSFRRL
jgi:hypothetical protein